MSLLWQVKQTCASFCTSLTQCPEHTVFPALMEGAIVYALYMRSDCECDGIYPEATLAIAEQARPVPSTQAALIDYFLETESGEMQYETARMRPLLSDDWFSFLAKSISESSNAALMKPDFHAPRLPRNSPFLVRCIKAYLRM